MWITREIAVPAHRCWDLLVDTDQWSAWGPSVAAVRLAADPAAATDRPEEPRPPAPRSIGRDTHGWVKPAIGPWIPFEVTSFDPGQSWAWKVAGVPATAHRVESLGDDRCRVGFRVPRWALPYAAVCALALRRIEGLATAD